MWKKFLTEKCELWAINDLLFSVSDKNKQNKKPRIFLCLGSVVKQNGYRS